MKKIKRKKCTHSVTYFNKRLGCIVCQYCGQPVSDLKFGKSKVWKPIKKKISKKGLKGIPSKSIKMGYERQRPEVVNAEKLKRKYLALKAKINIAKKYKGKNSQEYKSLKNAETTLIKEMNEFEKNREDGS